jgi:alpha/beta superfamily hydrolase
MVSGMTTSAAPFRINPIPATTRLRSASLRSIALTGPTGLLEALVNEGAHDAPFAALVCHPHPLGGGTMHNKVVYHAMKALNDREWGLGWPVLRFNFRGAGLSHGKHDGEAESGDVLAALEWLENEYKLPTVVVGFSFGAAMGLTAGCSLAESQDRIRALALLGLPTQVEGRGCDYPGLKGCKIPKLFLSGDRDQFAPAEQLTRVAASAGEPKRLVLLPGADHFFAGQLEPMQHTLSVWLKEQLT